MKTPSRLFLHAAAGALVLALAGCAATPAQKPIPKQDHEQHHPRPSASQGMGKAHADTAMMDKDMEEMCDMHDRMMSAKSPQDRRAMMQEHMKSMSPDAMQKHMEMMQKKMAMPDERSGAHPAHQ